MVKKGELDTSQENNQMASTYMKKMLSFISNKGNGNQNHNEHHRRFSSTAATEDDLGESLPPEKCVCVYRDYLKRDVSLKIELRCLELSENIPREVYLMT